MARVASGLDAPIQDPLSLFGDCVEGTRCLQGASERLNSRGGISSPTSSEFEQRRYNLETAIHACDG